MIGPARSGLTTIRLDRPRRGPRPNIARRGYASAIVGRLTKERTRLLESWIAAPMLWLIPLVLAGCRSEPERSAVAQAAGEAVASRTVAGAVAVAMDTPTVRLRRLSTSDDYDGFRHSSISPDGRYVTLIDLRTYNLAVRDLQTGELHLLTDAYNEEGKPLESAGPSLAVFSPDGRRIAYGWHHGLELQLRVIEFEPDEAGVPPVVEPAVIFQNSQFRPYDPFDWSPDGSQILANVMLAVDPPANTWQLALISTTDGGHQALKSFDWRVPLRAEFSPDGRHVAYDFPPDIESPSRDIFVLSVDGMYEATIVGDPAFDRLLGWHPDGSILFESDRGGTPGLWRLPMADGRPTGSPELVRGDMWGVEPLGFADGRLYYGANVNPSRLYTAAVDFAGGRLAGPPVAVDDPARIQIRGWDWSPDGKYFAYLGSTAGGAGSMIVIRSDRGEEVRALRLDLISNGPIRWAPDGKALIFFAHDGRGRSGFRRVDLETGSYTTILRYDQTQGGFFAFDLSPDGRTIWGARNMRTPPDDSRWSVIAQDIESGAYRSIRPVGWQKHREAWDVLRNVDRVTLSPDGAELALVVPDTTSSDRLVGTMPVGGGPFTSLGRVGENRLIRGLEWAADGRSIIFSTRHHDSSAGRQWTTWIVAPNGGEARRLELMKHVDPRGMKLHPDRPRVAFMAGESRGEVWVMEGLGQRSAASKEEGGSR
jgi:Tol biopolymer transport system component